MDPTARILIDRSHRVAPRVAALYNGELRGYLPVTQGNVTNDETQDVRGRCQLTFAVPDVPDEYMDPRDIDATGWRLFVEYGVYVSSTEIIYTPLGTYVVYDIQEQEDNHGHTVQITGYDTTVLLRDERFEQTVSIAAGTNYITAISNTITYIGLEVLLPTLGFTTPLLIFEEEGDRLKAVRDMALACGFTLIADAHGRITAMQPSTQVSSAGSDDFREGDDCKMETIAKKRTRQNVYNIAVVTGELAGGAPPVRGISYDSYPTSPTYVSATATGPFGRVPVFEKSQFVTTSAQAQAAADALLARKKGIGSQLTITARPNPSLEPGDVVAVRRDRLGVNTFVPLQSIDFNIAPGQPMSCVTRESMFV